MLRRLLKFLWRMTLFLTAAGLAILLLPRLITSQYALNRTYQQDNAPSREVAIVFGAGLRRDGSPSPILRDRVETAAGLYLSGRVQKLLMSGDGQADYYNEPEAMRRYALSLGVPQEAIALDQAGRRTYDTCYRAKEVFGVTSALLVTQKFHLPRALFLCNALGLDASGVETTSRRSWRGTTLIWNIREQFATVGAFLDIFVSSPYPVTGEPQPLSVD